VAQALTLLGSGTKALGDAVPSCHRWDATAQTVVTEAICGMPDEAMDDQHITMDGEECGMIERYEGAFGETPPVAFLDPDTSMRMMRRAFEENRPFDEADVARETEGDDDHIAFTAWLEKGAKQKGGQHAS